MKYRLCYKRKDGNGKTECGQWNNSLSVIESWVVEMNEKYSYLVHWVDTHWENELANSKENKLVESSCE